MNREAIFCMSLLNLSQQRDVIIISRSMAENEARRNED
jgi:hypothetical protein